MARCSPPKHRLHCRPPPAIRLLEAKTSSVTNIRLCRSFRRKWTPKMFGHGEVFHQRHFKGKLNAQKTVQDHGGIRNTIEPLSPREKNRIRKRNAWAKRNSSAGWNGWTGKGKKALYEMTAPLAPRGAVSPSCNGGKKCGTIRRNGTGRVVPSGTANDLRGSGR